MVRTITTGERSLTGPTFLTEISLRVVEKIDYGACLAHGIMSDLFRPKYKCHYPKSLIDHTEPRISVKQNT